MGRVKRKSVLDFAVAQIDLDNRVVRGIADKRDPATKGKRRNGSSGSRIGIVRINNGNRRQKRKGLRVEDVQIATAPENDYEASRSIDAKTPGLRREFVPHTRQRLRVHCDKTNAKVPDKVRQRRVSIYGSGPCTFGCTSRVFNHVRFEVRTGLRNDHDTLDSTECGKASNAVLTVGSGNTREGTEELTIVAEHLDVWLADVPDKQTISEQHRRAMILVCRHHGERSVETGSKQTFVYNRDVARTVVIEATPSDRRREVSRKNAVLNEPEDINVVEHKIHVAIVLDQALSAVDDCDNGFRPIEYVAKLAAVVCIHSKTASRKKLLEHCFHVAIVGIENGDRTAVESDYDPPIVVLVTVAVAVIMAVIVIVMMIVTVVVIVVVIMSVMVVSCRTRGKQETDRQYREYSSHL